MKYWIWLVGLIGAMPAYAQTERQAADWRQDFQALERADTSLAACRAELPEYCSWEYRKSREESETTAFREYLDARARGESVDDPLAGKVYVPAACQELFETLSPPPVPHGDPGKPETCLSRTNALLAAIAGVERYWETKRLVLEREARGEGYALH